MKNFLRPDGSKRPGVERLPLHKYAPWAATLCLGLAVFLFWRLRYPFALVYQEQLQMFLFDDDYLASGGLVALLEAGLRIPDDIRVATFCNRGDEPVMAVSFARIECDPTACADAAADYTLAVLAGKQPKLPRPEFTFIPGDSLG